MEFDQLISAATERAAEAAEARRTKKRVYVRESILRVLSNGVDPDNEIAVIKAVLRDTGYDSPGYDAMPDEDLQVLLSRASTIKNLLRAVRKGRQEDQA